MYTVRTLPLLLTFLFVTTTSSAMQKKHTIFNVDRYNKGDVVAWNEELHAVDEDTGYSEHSDCHLCDYSGRHLTLIQTKKKISICGIPCINNRKLYFHYTNHKPLRVDSVVDYAPAAKAFTALSFAIAGALTVGTGYIVFMQGR